MLRELRDGDVLGDHTFTHPDLTAGANVREQLQRTIGVIRSLTGYTPCVFRPPYGDYDAGVLQTARSLGLATVLWNVDPSDWAQPPAQTIVQRVLAAGAAGVDHHLPRRRRAAREDAGGLPADHRGAAAAGLRIVTIPELLGFRPVYVRCVKLCDGLGVPARSCPATRSSPGLRTAARRASRVSAARARALGCVEYGAPGGFARAQQQHRAPVAQWSTGLFGVPKSSGLSSRRPRVRFPPGALASLTPAAWAV